MSLAGRSILIRSVLLALPLYTIAYVHVPLLVLHKIEKEIRAFLWGHAADPRAMHLVP